jgi:hypothetical protein
VLTDLRSRSCHLPAAAIPALVILGTGLVATEAPDPEAVASINGVRMPVSLETKAQLRLLGSSALRMTYRYSVIDEQIIDDEAVDCAEC